MLEIQEEEKFKEVPRHQISEDKLQIEIKSKCEKKNQIRLFLPLINSTNGIKS